MLIEKLSPSDPGLTTIEFLTTDSLDDAIRTGQLLVQVLCDQLRLMPVDEPPSSDHADPSMQVAEQLLANERALLRCLSGGGGQRP